MLKLKSSEPARKTWERTKTKGLLRHRGGRYYGRFTLAGKTKFHPLETDLLEIARTRFAEEKAKVERMRKAARSTKDGSARMADLLTLHIEGIKNREGISVRTRARYLDSAEYIRKTWPSFPTLLPEDITRTAVETWRADALKNGTNFKPPGAKTPSKTSSGNSPTSFNKAVDALRSMLDIAVEKGALHANPLRARGIKAPYKPRKPKLPDVAGLHAIFEEIETGSGVAGQGVEIADFCRFLCFTGCRLKEAGAITWADIDFNRGVLHVAGTKTEGSRREVPLIPAGRALFENILARRKRAAQIAINGEPHVDPASRVLGVSEAAKSLTRACAALHTPRLTHHDLRDAFATQAIEAGVDIPTVAHWLGHLDGGALLMQTYAHHRRAHSIVQAAKVNF